MIPGDGEGATHRITIDVEGRRDRDEARAIARAVADSPLVKTAIHGADPNWGRIVSAAGYAGVAFDEADLSLWLNGVPLYRDGVPLAFDAAAVSADLRANRETSIRLVLNHGPAVDPVLDVRPHGRLRPAQRRLHDLIRFARDPRIDPAPDLLPWEDIVPARAWRSGMASGPFADDRALPGRLIRCHRSSASPRRPPRPRWSTSPSAPC